MGTRRSEMREKVTRAGEPAREPVSESQPADPTAEEVALAAYYRAEARGFEPGHEVEDWLEAEQELRTGHH